LGQGSKESKIEFGVIMRAFIVLSAPGRFLLLSFSLLIFLLISSVACQEKKKATEEDVPAEVAKPKPVVPKADGDCGEDAACFLAKAKNCEKARGTVKNSLDILGQKQEQSWAYEIHGEKDGKCDFRRTLVGLKLVISEDLKKMMKEDGVTDAEIAEEETNAFAKIKEKGEAREVCLLSKEALVTLLTAEQAGRFNSEHSKDCEKPDVQCTDLPALAEGCSIGPCEGGQWPITCSAKNGKSEQCRFRGTVKPGAEISCHEGMTRVSFSEKSK
jgi:hypothetical protein